MALARASEAAVAVAVAVRSRPVAVDMVEELLARSGCTCYIPLSPAKSLASGRIAFASKHMLRSEPVLGLLVAAESAVFVYSLPLPFAAPELLVQGIYYFLDAVSLAVQRDPGTSVA